MAWTSASALTLPPPTTASAPAAAAASTAADPLPPLALSFRAAPTADLSALATVRVGLISAANPPLPTTHVDDDIVDDPERLLERRTVLSSARCRRVADALLRRLGGGVSSSSNPGLGVAVLPARNADTGAPEVVVHCARGAVAGVYRALHGLRAELGLQLAPVKAAVSLAPLPPPALAAVLEAALRQTLCFQLEESGQCTAAQWAPLMLSTGTLISPPPMSRALVGLGGGGAGEGGNGNGGNGEQDGDEDAAVASFSVSVGRQQQRQQPTNKALITVVFQEPGAQSGSGEGGGPAQAALTGSFPARYRVFSPARALAAEAAVVARRQRLLMRQQQQRPGAAVGAAGAEEGTTTMSPEASDADLLADPQKLAAASRALQGKAVRVLPAGDLAFIRALHASFPGVNGNASAAAEVAVREQWLGKHGYALPPPAESSSSSAAASSSSSGARLRFLWVEVAASPDAEDFAGNPTPTAVVPGCCVLTAGGVAPRGRGFGGRGQGSAAARRAAVRAVAARFARDLEDAARRVPGGGVWGGRLEVELGGGGLAEGWTRDESGGLVAGGLLEEEQGAGGDSGGGGDDDEDGNEEGMAAAVAAGGGNGTTNPPQPQQQPRRRRRAQRADYSGLMAYIAQRNAELQAEAAAAAPPPSAAMGGLPRARPTGAGAAAARPGGAGGRARQVFSLTRAPAGVAKPTGRKAAGAGKAAAGGKRAAAAPKKARAGPAAAAAAAGAAAADGASSPADAPTTATTTTTTTKKATAPRKAAGPPPALDAGLADKVSAAFDAAAAAAAAAASGDAAAPPPALRAGHGLTVPELQAFCRATKLTIGGKKADLEARVAAHLLKVGGVVVASAPSVAATPAAGAGGGDNASPPAPAAAAAAVAEEQV